MKTKWLAVILSFFAGGAAVADTAQYPGVFALKDLNSGKELGVAHCTVLQNLSWEDYRIFSTCSFNDNSGVIAYSGWPNGAGYDYDLSMAFVKLGMSSDKEFGKFLLSHMSTEPLTGTNEMKIYFGPDQPFTSDKAMFTGTNGDLIELSFTPGKYHSP